MNTVVAMPVAPFRAPELFRLEDGLKQVAALLNAGGGGGAPELFRLEDGLKRRW